MKKVIIVDVSINNKLNKKAIAKKISNHIKEYSNDYDLYCFDTFAYQLDDIDDFIESDFEYNKPCAYYDCLMEIMRLYAGKDNDRAVFYIISEHIDDCSRLADEEIYERYIQHIKSNYGALIYNSDSDDSTDEYTPGIIESLMYRLKYEIRYPWIRYSDDPDDEDDDYYDEPSYLVN